MVLVLAEMDSAAWVALILASFALAVVWSLLGALVLRWSARRTAKLEWTYGKAFTTTLVPLAAMQLIFLGMWYVFAARGVDVSGRGTDGRPSLLFQLGWLASWFSAQVATIAWRHGVRIRPAAGVAGLAALFVGGGLIVLAILVAVAKPLLAGLSR